MYSPDKIPVNQVITAGIENADLDEALDELLADVPVKYVVVGERVVLKPDRLKKLRDFTKYEIPQPQDEAIVLRSPIVKDTTTVEGEISGTMPALDSITIQPSVKLLVKEKIQNIRGSGGNSIRIPPIDLSFLDDLDRTKGTMRAAQVSIAPGVSSNLKGAKEMTNRFSFNATWGLNGGVNGGEIGLLGNTVKGNMAGHPICRTGQRCKRGRYRHTNLGLGEFFKREYFGRAGFRACQSRAQRQRGTDSGTVEYCA